MEEKIIEGKLLNVKVISLAIFAFIMVPVNVIWFKIIYNQNVYDCASWKWTWDWVVERYGKNANVFTVTIHDYKIPFIIVLFASALVAGIFYLIYSKTELVVTDKRVYGKTSWGKRVDLPIDSVSAVGTSFLNTIAVTTASGAIKFGMIVNRNEVHEKITNLLVKRQGERKNEVLDNAIVNRDISSADELKKYKDLLDQGIISQEEFDAKKKQLLGL